MQLQGISTGRRQRHGHSRSRQAAAAVAHAGVRRSLQHSSLIHSTICLNAFVYLRWQVYELEQTLADFRGDASSQALLNERL